MSGAPVRVRFAPSPTGWLHVGGARTAYFNWLFARQHRGVFIVRIEDTDVERSTAASEAGVLEDLRWLGLDADEGPGVGGPVGPYRQSERLDLYRERAERLTGAGLAYPCFCTDAELDERRQAAAASGRSPHYDGRCRRLTAEERQARLGEGRPHSIRFAVEPRDVVLHDRVRGEVRFPEGVVGDFVLLRSNGLPTYNFACVVDDAGMKISHVLRAEEHLANTPRQLMLYEALGEKPPEFAHVALILNRDRTKMSKRSGEAAVAVGDWRRDGFVPEALLGYLALLGFHPGDDREILTREELLEAFTLDRLGKSGSVFDPDKLRWMNAHWIHHATAAQIRGWCAAARLGGATAGEPSWTRAIEDAEARGAAGPHLDRLLDAVRSNLATLADLPGELEPFVAEAPTLDDEARATFESPGAARVLEAAASELETLAEWSGETVKSAIQQIGKRLGVKGRDLFQPLRAALTGRIHGPELPLVADLLGRERTVRRLRAAESRRTDS